MGLSELGLATQKDSYPGLSWSDVNKLDSMGNYSFATLSVYQFISWKPLSILTPSISTSTIYIYNYLANGTTTFAELYGWLILDFFIYLGLAIYCDNVIPSAYGTSRPLYYFLMPSYWTGQSRPTSKAPSKMKGLNELEMETIGTYIWILYLRCMA